MKARSDVAVKAALLSSVEPIPFAGCWLWTRSCMANGYGQLGFRGSNAYAHRVSWTLHNGEIPAGQSVLHRCDVRCCVNPAHLFLGSQQENMEDMIAKGRQDFHWKRGMTPHNKARPSEFRGERHGMARLTTEQVLAIRLRYANGETQKSLASVFGVNQPHISRIIRNQNWRIA